MSDVGGPAPRDANGRPPYGRFAASLAALLGALLVLTALVVSLNLAVAPPVGRTDLPPAEAVE